MSTGSVAFVAERTRSTPAAARARSSQRTARPRLAAASASPFSCERFVTRISETPSSARSRAVSSAVSPAPMRRTLRPFSDSKMRAARPSARPATDVGFWPSAVSARTRLPHSRALMNSRFVTVRTVPAAVARRCASRICPRICASPTTIESRPAATRKRWRTVASPRPESAVRRSIASSTLWNREKNADERVEAVLARRRSRRPRRGCRWRRSRPPTGCAPRRGRRAPRAPSRA